MEETNRNRSGNYSLDLAFLIASGLMFGTFPIFAALLTGTGVNALEQATWRFLLALPVFFVIGIALEKTTLFIIDRSDAILFLSQGVVLFLAAITFVEAISLGLEANLTGFLGNISPIFVIVLQRALFKEKISWKKAFAVMLSILGAGLLLAGSGINSGSAHAYLGGLVAIASSFFFGTFVIMNGGSSHSRKHNSLQILFWSFFGASLSSSVVGLLLGITPGAVSFVLPHFTTHQWELLGGLSFFSSSIPFLLLTLGERTIQASTASIILLLTPISSGVISVIVLGEFLTLVQIIGGCFVVIGIALVIRSR